MGKNIFFREKLEGVVDFCPEDLEAALRQAGHPQFVGTPLSKLSAAEPISRQKTELLASITKEILCAFYDGVERLRDRSRITFLERTFGNQCVIAEVLGIDRSGFSKIRTSGNLTKSTRSRFDAKYNSAVSWPLGDDCLAEGYLEATMYARQKVLGKPKSAELTREDMELILRTIPDKHWRQILGGIGQVRTFVDYGTEIIQEYRRSVGETKIAWRVENSFTLAALFVAWVPSFYIANSVIWDEINEPRGGLPISEFQY
jgi:hypothetical protein